MVAQRVHARRHHSDHVVMAEGRVYTVEQARAAGQTGALAVVVGTAITHPSSITGWFRAAVLG